jgi:predicted nucleotidyltransferase
MGALNRTQPIMSPADRSVAEEIKRKLLEADGGAIQRIVLHGSRASGHARPGSDYDILIVMRHEVDDWMAESLRFSEFFVYYENPVDIQVFGREEFEECRPVPATIAYPANQSGIVLYAELGNRGTLPV